MISWFWHLLACFNWFISKNVIYKGNRLTYTSSKNRIDLRNNHIKKWFKIKIWYTLQKCLDPFFTLKKNKTGNCLYRLIRDRSFNLQGGIWFFFRSEFFFRTTRVFFVEQNANFFLQKLTLGYMTKTLNQIIFFPPP